jgi:phage shock protein A
MTFRLRMPAQIGDWLADLRESEPGAAAEVGAAVTALVRAAQPRALAIVTDPDDPDRGNPQEILDRTYQDLLSRLQLLRRKAADATTTRKNAEKQLAEERARAGGDDNTAAALTQLRDRAHARERALKAGSARLQRYVDAFGAHTEVVRALYAAADAGLRIEQAADSGVEWADGLGSSHGELSAAASERTRRLLAQARRLREDIRACLRADYGAAGRDAEAEREGQPAESGADPGLPEVLELRADPLAAEIRVFFAIEPPGTATLLTALEGAAAVRQNRDTAIVLAGELLAEIRADREADTSEANTATAQDASDSDPEGADASDSEAKATDASDAEDARTSDPEDVGGWLEFASAAEFLAAYFPGAQTLISARAEALATAISLARLRRERGLSLADLAHTSGLSEKWLRSTENGDLRTTSLHEVAAYVRALGGRLELAANIDGDLQDLA